MQRFSKLTTATFGAIALIGATSAPAMASPASKAAIACQGGLQGCVLPVGNAAPPAPPAPAPAPPPPAVAPAPVVESGGAGWIIPALLGVAAIVAAVLILDDDDDDDEAISA